MSDYETREHEADQDRLSGPVPDAWEPPTCHASESARAYCERLADDLPDIACPCGRAPGLCGCPGDGCDHEHLLPRPAATNPEEDR